MKMVVWAIAILGCFNLSGMTAAAEEKSPRIVVLGIDSLGFPRVTKLIRNGKLPNLAALAKEGTVVKLANQASFPHVQWMAALSGFQPYSMEEAGSNIGGHEKLLPEAHVVSLGRPTKPRRKIWDILEHLQAPSLFLGLKQHCIDCKYVRTFPTLDLPKAYSQTAKEVFDGIQAPCHAARYYLDPTVGERDELSKKFAEALERGNQSSWKETLRLIPTLKQDSSKGFERQTVYYSLQSIHQIHEVTKELVDQSQFKLFFSLYSGLDAADHRTTNPTKDDMYRYIDTLVGEIQSKLSKDDHLIIMSVHSVGEPDHSYYPTEPILMAAGPGIAPAQLLIGASIEDVFPTLLYMLEIEVEYPIEGRILARMFTKSYRSSHVFSKKVTAEAAASMKQIPNWEVTEEQMNAVQEQKLRDLKRASFTPPASQ